MASSHLYLLLLITGTFADDHNSEDSEVRYRISKGQPVDIEQYPWMVQVEFYNVTWEQNCAANILNEFYVLSAAHCFCGAIISDRRIRAGTAIRNTGGIVVTVDSVFIHPDYGKLHYDSDIAVVRLSSPLQYSSTIQPVNVIEQGYVIPDNSEVKVAGWGAISEYGFSSDVLLEITIYTINNELCAQQSQNLNYFFKLCAVTKNMICAGLIGVGGRDVCLGDSGGVLIYENKLNGLVSWNLGCSYPFFTGVYTNIASYRDWIDATIGNSKIVIL